MKQAILCLVSVLFLSPITFAGVRNGDTFTVPASAGAGATTATAVVKVTPLGGTTVKVKSGNGKSGSVEAQQSAGGGPEVDETERDMTVKGKDPETGESTTGNTYRVKNGKLQYKDKNGKWRTAKPKPKPEPPEPTGSDPQTASPAGSGRRLMLIQVPFGPLSMPVLFSLSGGGSGTSGTLPFG